MYECMNCGAETKQPDDLCNACDYDGGYSDETHDSENIPFLVEPIKEFTLEQLTAGCSQEYIDKLKKPRETPEAWLRRKLNEHIAEHGISMTKEEYDSYILTSGGCLCCD